MESVTSFRIVQLGHETSVAVRGRFGKVLNPNSNASWRIEDVARSDDAAFGALA
jgi:hypothetical protein